MLSWPPTDRIFLAAGPTDMRKGFHSLASAVEAAMALDHYSGHLFVFRSRRGDWVKLSAVRTPCKLIVLRKTDTGTSG